MNLSSQEIFGVISVVISFSATVFYVVSIFRGQTKPHLFTWIVWTILPAIGFFAQRHDDAGAGSWASGLTAIDCFFITLLALKYGEKHFTRSDKIAFAASLSAIIPWVLTKDPLGSVILISLIDLVAFYPTFRKSWAKPREENLTTYAVASAMMVFSLLAMEAFTVTTLLYPAAFASGNLVFVVFCLWRRRVLKETS